MGGWFLLFGGFVLWAGLVPSRNNAGGESQGMWRLFAMAATTACALPILGYLLVLRGHPGGGALVAAACGLLLIPTLLSLPTLAGAGPGAVVLLFVTTFLATNVWAGVQAMRGNLLAP